jgi:Fe-Mn family superoxide dismutase
MAFQLPELNFSYDALEPIMDTKTIEVHHDKHHAGYTANLNKAFEKYPEFYDKDIVQILQDLTQVPEEVRLAVKNNGGGFYHHNLWWEQFTASGETNPSDAIRGKIETSFGDFDTFRKKLGATATGVFGSGWGWLCKDAVGKLVLTGTPNQDSPVSNGLTPLIAVDVWEHAYYLKYQNRRAEFVENLWKILNWSVIEARFG